ncbi:MAG TPA: hypothetical protein PLQ76_01700, partial [bacterium]|nr:hypothetical protein [bacterium]
VPPSLMNTFPTFMLPLFCVYMLLTPGVEPRGMVARLFVFGIFTSFIGGGWYIRNTVIYGDPIGHSAILKILPHNPPDLQNPKVLASWLSFVYAHFWMFNNFLRNMVMKCPQWAYAAFIASGGIAAAGLLRAKLFGFREMSSLSKKAFILMAAGIAFSFAGLVFQNTKQYAAEGRYLYPTLVPIFVLFYEGHKGLMSKDNFPAWRAAYIAGFTIINLYFVYKILIPAPMPPVYPPF